MPKKLIEINKFIGGIVSTPSATDIDEQSAKYSSNIDAQTSDGRLQGIDEDKILTSSGFAKPGTGIDLTNSSTRLVREMIAVSDKKNKDEINLVVAKSSINNNSIEAISVLRNIYGTGNISEQTLSDTLSSVDGEYDLSIEDNKVLVGMGGEENGDSKVVMRPSSNGILGNSDETIGIFDAGLEPPDMNAFASMFSEFMMFPIHGTTPSGTGIAYNDAIDTNTAKMWPDYDFALPANNSGGTLYTYITGNSVSVGQILKLDAGHSHDFSDDALLNWKKYDYDSNTSGSGDLVAVALAAHDLFMYCGDTSDGAPILRFIGTASAQGGTPAFAYAIKDDSSSLYKISLTTNKDANAFAAGNITISKNAGTAAADLVTIARQTSRITSINLNNSPDWTGNYITAFSACSSPPLYNNLGLVDANVNPHTTSSNTFYANGHLKVLYRHGVFYVSSRHSSEILYRVNAIDFHSLSGDSIPVDDLTLDFSRIPDQLHAEDGKGIVRRTLEDQLNSTQYDPKNQTWSNKPSNACIIGICETFDCGKIDSVSNETSTFTSQFAFKFTTKNQSRLTTGDVVRFAGMKIDADTTGEEEQDAFNTAEAYTVSVVDDGDAFLVNAGAGGKIPIINNAVRQGLWWNSKVWVLYGKKSSTASFNKWDLFLYNANTTETTNGRAVYMADRTPPYHQARYYETDVQTSEAGVDESGKLYYPGEFAFVKSDNTPGWGFTEQNEPPSDPTDFTSLVAADVPSVGSDISGSGVSGNFCEFGIYDKAGRWACNGVQRQADSNTGSNRPQDWVGGKDGPTAWDNEFQGTGGGPVNGDLYFGQNIGWSIDNERQVFPTKNSLHPHVPYSTLYNGSLFYTGYNSTDLSDKFGVRNGTPYSDRYINNNRPKHAVTFIGKIRGDFVINPPRIQRKGHIYQFDEWNTDDNMDRSFEIINSGDREVKTYNDDYTLFTIDDFSGHRGSVKYNGDASISITAAVGGTTTEYTDQRVPLGGIDLARPNWGGPEIEPSIYLGTFAEYGNDQNGSHTSVNGGYYDKTDLTNTDKGWDGYTPPYVFNPGSGYYVYINRTWKNMNRYRKYVGQNGVRKVSVWGFQEVAYTSQTGVLSNRWNNFSSTAISDNYKSKADINEEWYSSVNGENNPFDSGSDTYTCTRFNFYESGNPDNQPTFNGMPSKAQSVCTMHKLAISDMGEINSIFPVILNSNIATDNSGMGNSDNDFYSGYLCGTDRGLSGDAGALILRTNLDYLWDREADNANTENRYDYRGSLAEPRLFTNFYPFNGYKYAIKERGTHYAETINISNTDTLYTPQYGSTTPDSLQMKQANLDTYTSTITGNQLVLAAKTPYLCQAEALQSASNQTRLAANNFDWWMQVNAKSNSDLYLGTNEDSFLRTTGSAYTEDSDGLFFGGTGNDADDSGQLFGAANDPEILTSLTSFISFETSSEGSAGTLAEGTYYYKLAYEYDDIYESPLTANSVPKTLSPSTANNVYEYIKLSISIPSEIVGAIPDRVTGIAVYRKYEGGDSDEYSKIGVIKFEDTWIFDSSNESYNIEIYDDGALQGSYFSNNGIDQTIEDTSLNYGLSTVFQGYLFVSKAWHPKLKDVRRYIFRSQPDNFFAFNWTDDFVIMPETIKAMVSFNSRLYAWGENSLYKIDPYSMLIEDTYEGVSILNKDSFVKTEFGLCFMDKNNVYIHDGNKPTSIADPILYSSNDSVVYNTDGTDGYIKLEQGYRELVSQSIANGHKPHISYSGLKDSFLIHLSNSSENGKVFSFNIKKRRWDLWDSPKPYAVTSSKDSNTIISDGTSIYNYLSLESDEWTDYNRREWDWFSKDINFGTDTQDKVFRSIKFLGTPSIYETGDTIGEYDSANSKTASVQAYVDNDLVNLIVKNKFYETINLGGVYLKYDITDDALFCNIQTEIVPLSSNGAATSDGTKKQQSFIQSGHLIKIDDEIMLVTTSVKLTDTTYLNIVRGVMGTTAVAHTGATSTSINVVSPILKFPPGTKGKNLSLRLVKQKGYIDSIGVVYKPKSIK